MGNNLRWTPEQLKQKGLVQNANGDYVPVKSLVNTGKVEKIEIDGKKFTQIKDGKFTINSMEYPPMNDPSLIERAIPIVDEITKAQLAMKIFQEQGVVFMEAHKDTFMLPTGAYINVLYRFDISPVAAPRMTQSDKWKIDPHHSDPNKRQRVPVAKYFTFRNNLLSQCAVNGYKLTKILNILFIVPMPETWSKKKKLAMNNQPHLCRPDRDNFLKAFQDSFTGDDGYVYDGRTIKLWGNKGEIIIF